MFLFVGLGNPGPKYEKNRHNIGFMAVDEIVRRHGFSDWRRKFHAEVCEGRIAGERVLALKPLTFMNDSGRAVQDAAQFLKIDEGNIFAFYDELDLVPGKVRVKRGGGAAGHNGIRSMIAHVGEHFHRVRLGIGHPGVKDLVYGHVLGDFAKSDAAWVKTMLESVAENAGLLIEGKEGPFQSKVHLALNPVPKKPGDHPL
jgi:peptidyl-tRNA hydrolase, PTH1 family